MTQSILLTGVHTRFGARVARLLSQAEGTRVVALGRSAPAEPTGQAEVLIRKLEGQALVSLLHEHAIETCIHLDFEGEETAWRNREAGVQRNILASMEVVGACLHAGVKRFLTRSSTLVYGASHTHPCFVEPSTTVRIASQRGVVRHYAEFEQWLTSFEKAHPQIAVTRLRIAPIVGEGIWSPLGRWLAQPVPRMRIGFSPRIQIIHPDDAAAACVQASTHPDLRGVLHIAAQQPLPLLQLVRLRGRQPIGIPGLALMLGDYLDLGNWLLANWEYDRAFLLYDCVVETRQTRQQLDWQPTHDALAIARATAVYLAGIDPQQAGIRQGDIA